VIPTRFSSRLLVAAAGAGSAGLLLGALAFQFMGGLAPCPLCVWQRWPHLAAVVLAVLGLTVLGRFLRPVAVLGAAAAATSAAIGVYHTGIERHWWTGPTTCTSGDITTLSNDQLLNQIMNAPLVRCDEVAWEMFGLSMASWNVVISLGLAGLWLAAALRAADRQDSSSASQ